MSMMRTASIILACLLPTTALSQQPGLGPGGTSARWPGLQLADPTIEDLGPSGVSYRILPQDMLASPVFETLYEYQSPAGERAFVRFDGAIAAVFPRSTYVLTRRGLRAEIPPGTVFHIGAHPEDFQASRADLSDVRRGFGTAAAPDQSARPGPSGTLVPRHQQPPSVQRRRADAAQPTIRVMRLSIFYDDATRNRRLRSLLRQAAGQEPASDPSP